MMMVRKDGVSEHSSLGKDSNDDEIMCLDA